MAQILIFGASTTYGAWDIEGGWVQRLRRALDQKFLSHKLNDKYYNIVYNLGIDGDTADGVLKRFENEAKPRIWPEEETIIIFHIGLNDGILVHKTNQTQTPLKKYQETLDKLVNKAKKYCHKVILVGAMPVDEKKVDPIPWLPGHSYRNEFVISFSQIMESTAHLNRVHFIPLFDRFSKDAGKLLADGVHPNSRGHEAIFKTVKDYLISNKLLEL